MKKIRYILAWIIRQSRRLLRRLTSPHATSHNAKPHEIIDQPSISAEPCKTVASHVEQGTVRARTTGRGRSTASQTSSSFASPAAFRAESIRFNEDFLSRHYHLRYNTMKRVTEFCPKSPETPVSPAAPEASVTPAAPEAPWLPLTERDLNRITVEQLKEGGQSWSYGMKLVIDSSSVPNFNPVQHYLDTCPEWDRHDHIGDLARRVPTAYDRWPEFFHRWMLAMVAQVTGMSRDHGNAIVPLLIGPQGTHKSTFCKNILPIEMREYYMDDIKMDNAEQVERVLGRMWLVCIDEYNAKSPREQAKIKRLLTEKDVQVRRMRSDQYSMTPRLCSFIATTNERQPLCDTTGSRRYLCIEVEGNIDMPQPDAADNATQAPINHRQLFAQALWELRHGHAYYFSHEEEAAIEEHNQQYMATTAVEELISYYYEPAEVSKDTLLRATDILHDLQQRVKGPDCPTMRQLIEALKRQRFRSGAQQGRHGWYARTASTV